MKTSCEQESETISWQGQALINKSDKLCTTFSLINRKVTELL